MCQGGGGMASVKRLHPWLAASPALMGKPCDRVGGKVPGPWRRCNAGWPGRGSPCALKRRCGAWMKRPSPTPARPRGGARQDGGTLGTVANGQVAIRVQWRRAEASGPLHGRRSLPQAGVENQERAAPGRVPPGTTSRRQTAVALDLIDQVRRWEVPALPGVAASVDGDDCGFRPALRPRRLPSAVEVEATPSVWTEEPNVPRPPPKQTGRPRR